MIWPIKKLVETLKKFLLELLTSLKSKKEDSALLKIPSNTSQADDKKQTEELPMQNTNSINESEEKTPITVKQNQTNNIFKGDRPLDKGKIAEMAGKYGLDLASVLAVAEIESGGRSGFQKTGLLTILFEAHIFYRELKKAGLSRDTLMVQYPNLISPNWNRSLYKGGDAENTRLAEALKIHECAWTCASYGMFQIMGFNHRACGFSTVQDFVEYLKSGQEAHVETFLKFISSDSRKINALKNKDWATFARLYNGSAYAENKYDIKLAEAYKKHSSL